MYGSSFCSVTRRPRLFSRRPSEEAVSPFPSELATPPVTKMCFVTGFYGIAPSPPLHGPPNYSGRVAGTAAVTAPTRTSIRIRVRHAAVLLAGAVACVALFVVLPVPVSDEHTILAVHPHVDD